jgi:hypothetical protein
VTLAVRRIRRIEARVERTVTGGYLVPMRWAPPPAARTLPQPLRSPDAYLASFAKSGRMWVAFSVANYLRIAHGLEPPVDFETVARYVPDAYPMHAERGVHRFGFAHRPEVPLLALSHAPFAARRYRAPVILLLRDPRAIIVSAHRYASRHLRGTDGRFVFEGSLADFLEAPNTPFDLSRWLDSWVPAVERGRVEITTYERWHASPAAELERLVRALGIVPDARVIEEAVSRSRFEEMRASEIRRPRAPDYDVSDPDARHVRRGDPAGWREELTDEQAAALGRTLDRVLTRRSKRVLAAAGLAASFARE